MEEEDRIKVIERRLGLIEDEIDRVQKDIQILGENCKVEVPCFNMFENSLTKKLIKERDGTENTH